MSFIPVKVAFFVATAVLVTACCWDSSKADLDDRHARCREPLQEWGGLDDESLNEEHISNPCMCGIDSRGVE